MRTRAMGLLQVICLWHQKKTYGSGPELWVFYKYPTSDTRNCYGSGQELGAYKSIPILISENCYRSGPELWGFYKYPTSDTRNCNRTDARAMGFLWHQNCNGWTPSGRALITNICHQKTVLDGARAVRILESVCKCVSPKVYGLD